MENIKGRIRRLRYYLTHHLSGALLSAAVIFFLGGIVVYLTFCENEAQVMVLMERMVQIFPEKNTNVFTSISYATSLIRNMEWIAALILIGCIPFAYLSAILLTLCSAMLAIAAAYYHASDVALRVFFTSFLPHGVIQVPCMLLAAALGIRLCRQLTKKLLGQNSTWYWQREVLYMLKVYIYILIPWIMISTYLETSITPYIIRHFGW